MMRAYAREIAATLMTAAMALPLATAPGAFASLDNVSALSVSVSGSPGTNAGMTVAIPVSDGNHELPGKSRQRGKVQQKHTGS